METLPPEAVASGLAVFGFGAFFIIAALIGALLTVIPFWKICQKAGFPGPLSLLMLVPIANIILPFYIAFAKWPVLKQK
jgi:hypothetical protein